MGIAMIELFVEGLVGQINTNSWVNYLNISIFPSTNPIKCFSKSSRLLTWQSEFVITRSLWCIFRGVELLILWAHFTKVASIAVDYTHHLVRVTQSRLSAFPHKVNDWLKAERFEQYFMRLLYGNDVLLNYHCIIQQLELPVLSWIRTISLISEVLGATS